MGQLRWFSFVCFIMCTGHATFDVRTILDSKKTNSLNGFLRIPHIPRQDPLLISILRDMMLINFNLFSWQSFAIISVTLPLYGIGAMADNKIHSCFYDTVYHKNQHALPKWAIDTSKSLIFAPLAILGSYAFFSSTEEKRLASRVFLEGAPLVWAAKDLIKQFETPAHERPKNEFFCPHKRVYGGFPSGHMALSMYMTLFYGLEFGHRYAVPLGLCSLITGALLVESNRHYFSQVIAGAALGALYAFAAKKVVEYDQARQFDYSLSVDRHGKPTFQVAWLF